MTTKPKARKFRIRKAPPPAAAVSGGAGAALRAEQPPVEDDARAKMAANLRAVANEPAPKAEKAKPQTPEKPVKDSAPAEPEQSRTGEVSSANEVSGEQDIDAIRREGLTGRQLRMARRVAQKHGLAPTSDFDAVRLLRAEGIDPFQRSNMLELVVPQDGDVKTDSAGQPGLPATRHRPGSPRVQLPQTTPGGRGVPSTEASPAERRQREISDIQRDITRRRRKKGALLLVRLAFFVMLPTLMAGYYFYKIATPMYATESQFLIIQNEGGGGASPFGGLLPTQFANSADSIATQAYLQSKDAMLRLDEDADFRAHFSDKDIDPIQRLTEDPTNEEAYKAYKKNVKIGYDPTEGVIRMEVIAADPAVSEEFSKRLLTYAEERVNDLSKQKREDGMRDALEGYETALANRRAAQEALIKLQVDNNVDPEAMIASIRTQITNYETLLIEKELELAALLDNQRPNKAKVDGARGDVRRLREQLAKLRERMTSASEGENSLAQQAVAAQLAQADLAAADMVLQSAQTGMEQARAEAGRQVRYLTVAVNPVAPDEATYPRKFENTILAFLIFAGIYLMLSLTASILREQVTS
ncbi:capsule biosynthesis protein [Sulfitobacter delicatus]|uniref:Capsular polysaccharide transport system permease protein n=1 Tax=Sulfitobacter delicatus TaxID=218672 RepID=A0A1G7U248_9RHOB|nr:capsule biosynthesis protein [Sulfitobacter delicatus]SDG41626.1 capsular polysaccharide transport system permease protein [Sulfitobacter delicatus]